MSDKVVEIHCEYCDELKGEEDCPGNDECIEKLKVCEGWSGMCCSCGADYAKGQME